jgi:phosphoribosylformylglycinamidine synthase
MKVRRERARNRKRASPDSRCRTFGCRRCQQPWEFAGGKPDRIASALDIMLEGPIGGAAFNNEFGRPNLLGYFRTFEQEVGGEMRGYHKPIMIAGGLGNLRRDHAVKHRYRRAPC